MRRVDADADAARDALAAGAEERGERRAVGAQLGVEHGHLQRRLGHRVAADRREALGDRGAAETLAAEAREQLLAHHQRRAVDVLGRVRRLVARDALAPSLGDAPRRCSCSARTSRMRRLVCTPKLVWNGVTRGRRISRSSVIRVLIIRRHLVLAGIGEADDATAGGETVTELGAHPQSPCRGGVGSVRRSVTMSSGVSTRDRRRGGRRQWRRRRRATRRAGGRSRRRR